MATLLTNKTFTKKLFNIADNLGYLDTGPTIES